MIQTMIRHRRFAGIVFICGFLAAPLLSAQPYTTAKAMLTAACQKSGWDQWTTLQSVRIERKVASLHKTETRIYKLPFHFYNHSESGNPPVKATEVFTPRRSWRVESNGKKFPLTNPPNTRHFPVWELTLLFDQGLKFKKSQLDGKAVYVISKPTADGKRYHDFYFDATSLRLVAADFNYFDSVKDLTYFEDYRQIQGFWLPYRERLNTKLIREIQSVRFNEPVDTWFAEPQ